MKTARIIFSALLTFITLYVCGCKDDASTEPEKESYAMAPPAIVEVNLSYVSNGQYVANIEWEPSKDENDENFTGYAVVTYGVDFEGNRNTESPHYDSAWVIAKTTHSYVFGFLERGKLYRTKVYSVSFNTEYSEAVKSETYGITEIAPPGQAAVNLDQAGSPYAVINWSASTDEALDDFVGYVVTTYEVASSGAKIAIFDSALVNKPSHSHVVSGLVAGKLYKTSIWSLLDNGDLSSPLETNTYAAIIKGSGEIDEMSSSNYSQSSYGWTIAGAGGQVSYSSANSAHIDIHCRADNAGNLILYSPASAPSPQLSDARTTLFLALSIDDWDKSNFTTEPNKSNIAVTAGSIILLKNADGYYVKLKIQSIATQGTGTTTYKKVTFDYKFQNVQGLRAAKR
jgi:hypothetical protein